MNATETERVIINALKSCRYQPGIFDKKFPSQIDVNNISPRQQYFIYKLGYKYRKQIGSAKLESICKNYITRNKEPLSRRDSEKILRKVKKIKI